MGRGARRGYTLLEVMVVVAIIAVLAAIAAINISRHKEHTTMRQQLLRLRGAIEQSRTLAAQAGSRLGTPRLALAASCLPSPVSNDTSNLWVVFSPPPAQQVRVPVALVPNAATDVMTVECELIDLNANAPEYRGVFTRNPEAFAFTATGRLIADGAAMPPEGFLAQVTHPDDSRSYGFRVLTSGIVCDASDPRPGNPILCDEDI